LIYRFGNFTLDSGRRELRQGNEFVALEPQVFDVLEFLIANRERVVSNDDLIESVWHGRVVSEATVTTRMNAVRRAVGDSGDRQQFIRTIARKGYRFVGEIRDESSPGSREATLSAPELSDPPAVPAKPSIAVLPFTNMSGDPEQEYFADGITEDLITALSQFRSLFVIARNSSFVFKGKAIDAKQIAREVGVRYLLEGSVRRSGNRVRITGQLIEASTATHLWADHFDGDLQDIFELQDNVTASVAGAIGPKLQQAEIDRAKRKPTERLDAYDYYLRGMANLHDVGRESTTEALHLFARAIQLDPDFASAYGMAAWCYNLRKWNGWMTDPTQETVETERLARRAVVLARDDAVPLCAGGFALAIVGDLEFGARCIDRALFLNPNLADAWYFGGWVSSLLGEPDVGIERIQRAMRLNPIALFPFSAHGAIAWAHFNAGRYDEAMSAARKAIQEQPNFLPVLLRILAAASAMAGRLDEARAAIARVRELLPTFRISDIKGVSPFRKSEDLARYEEALRRAGLPE
jgi:TolB-like protein